jgi:thiol-disulfide isomerase/thioredoxin
MRSSKSIILTTLILYSALTLSAALVSCNRADSPRTDAAKNTGTESTTNENVQSAGMGIETTANAVSADKVFTLQSVDAASGGKRADFAWAEGKKNVKLSEISKGKPVFLNFWATWCPPCRRELPDIVELHKEFGNKVVFVGVALENESKAAKAAPLVSSFAQKNNLNYINLVGDDKFLGKITGEYGNVEAIPTTFVIDKNGVIIDKLVGGKSKEEFLAALKKVM